MRRRRTGSHRRLSPLALLGILSVLIIGFPGRAPAQSVPEPPRLRHVALLPFFTGVQSTDIRKTLTCPVCRLHLEEDLAPGAAFMMTDLVQDALVLRHEDRAVPTGVVRSTLNGISADEDTPLSLAQRTGKALGADTVMVGFVWRFRQRVGGAAGVETPASVAFALYLIDVETGRVRWDGDFNETQRSLSENILEAGKFLKRGGRWLTALELARSGVEEIFEEYPFE